jgi:hypothetical protein
MVMNDDGAVLLQAMPGGLVETATERERLEVWVIGQVQEGASLPGLDSLNADTKARSQTFHCAQDQAPAKPQGA